MRIPEKHSCSVSLRLIVVVAAALVLGACEDDDEVTGVQNPGPDPDPAVQVTSMRLLIGDDTLSIAREGGTVTGSPVVIPRGPGSTPVAAEFLTADGTQVQLPSDEFRLEMAPNDISKLTYTAGGPFGGSLNPLDFGDNVVVVGLSHWSEGHVDIGPSVIDVQVQ